MNLEELNFYDNPNNINNNKEQIILNMYYNNETGKLILSDNYNNHYICDLFGRVKTKFLPNVTGQASYTQRQNFYSKNKKIQKIEMFNRPNTSKPLFLNKKGPIDYLPTTKKFEGYSKFPRPLSPPFTNVPDYEMKDQIKTELVQNLEKYFSDKNIKSIIINNLNTGLSYLTSDLNEFDCMKVDIAKILELIKITLDSLREKYIFKMKDYYKLPMVKALTQFSKFLSANKDTTIVNNRKLKKPNSLIKKRYDCIQSAISRHGLKKKNKTENIMTLNNDILYDNLKKKINFKNLAFDQNKKNLKYNNIINKNNFLKNLFKNYNKENDLILGKRIHMDFGSFSYEEEEKRKQNKKVALTIENSLSNTKKMENTLINAKKQYTEATKETEESNYVDKRETRSKTIDVKINENNLSFISNMSENEKKYEKENTKPLKGLKYMQNKFIKESNLLKGFKIEERKGFMYLFKNLKPKYKNNGELYEQDMNLLRRANPIAFKIQEKKDKFDMQQLLKKVNTQRINADNVMKGKKLKIQKSIKNEE